MSETTEIAAYLVWFNQGLFQKFIVVVGIHNLYFLSKEWDEVCSDNLDDNFWN